MFPEIIFQSTHLLSSQLRQYNTLIAYTNIHLLFIHRKESLQNTSSQKKIKKNIKSNRKSFVIKDKFQKSEISQIGNKFALPKQSLYNKNVYMLSLLLIVSNKLLLL